MFLYEEKLKKVLELLKVKDVYIEGFTSDQIFYQIRQQTEARIADIEKYILQECKSSVIEEDLESVESIKKDSSDSAEGTANNSSTSPQELSVEDSKEEYYASEDETTFEEDVWACESSSSDGVTNVPAAHALEMLNSRTFGKK